MRGSCKKPGMVDITSATSRRLELSPTAPKGTARGLGDVGRGRRPQRGLCCAAPGRGPSLSLPPVLPGLVDGGLPRLPACRSFPSDRLASPRQEQSSYSVGLTLSCCRPLRGGTPVPYRFRPCSTVGTTRGSAGPPLSTTLRSILLSHRPPQHSLLSSRREPLAVPPTGAVVTSLLALPTGALSSMPEPAYKSPWTSCVHTAPLPRLGLSSWASRAPHVP